MTRSEAQKARRERERLAGPPGVRRLCACGCGEVVPPRASKQRINAFIHNHHRRESPVEYVVDVNGCWLWQRYTSEDGYGIKGVGGKKIDKAHRVYYEQMRGPIPKGFEIHHLCGTRSCVNPEHLEAVTREQHRRRHMPPAEQISGQMSIDECIALAEKENTWAI